MQKLNVNNKTLQYKQTTYKIDHIKSVKIVESARKLNVDIPLEIANSGAQSKLLIACCIFGLSLALPFVGMPLTMAGIALLCSVLLFLASSAEFKKIAVRNKEIERSRALPTSEKFYGLSIRFPTDNGEVFWSSKKSNIQKAHDAVVTAMNLSGNTTTMENVTIEINDSQEVIVGGTKYENEVIS